MAAKIASQPQGAHARLALPSPTALADRRMALTAKRKHDQCRSGGPAAISVTPWLQQARQGPSPFDTDGVLCSTWHGMAWHHTLDAVPIGAQIKRPLLPAGVGLLLPDVALLAWAMQPTGQTLG